MVIVKLTNQQLSRLSEIFGNMGLIFFASLVLPYFTNVSTVNIVNLITGTAATLICVAGSLILLKGGV